MLTQKEISRLLDIALLGNHKGYTLQARTIFETILFFQKEHSGAILGLAHNYLTVGDFEKANELLQTILTKNKNDTEAKVLLGLSYFLQNKKEQAKSFLEEVANQSSSSKELAQNLLETL